MRILYLIALVMLTALPVRLGAVVLFSYTDGPWDQVAWSGEGWPEAGDTLVVRTTLRIDEHLPPVTIIVTTDGTLRLLPQGRSLLLGLNNHGKVLVDRGASLYIDGFVINDGILDGEGVVALVGTGKTLSGTGGFGNLLVAPPMGGALYVYSSVTLRSLSLSRDVRFEVGPYNLLVEGPYSAASLDPASGIFATTGEIRLNGTVSGSAHGRVTIGNGPDYHPSIRAGYPTVSGTLGGSGFQVRFSASRCVSFATLSGTTLIDSGVVLEGRGIGEGGSNFLFDSIINNGVLRGYDPTHRWIIDGSLLNNGRIATCTVSLRGEHPAVETYPGTWDPDVSLEYLGPSGGILELRGKLTVSHLTVRPLTSLDSNVMIHSSGGEVIVRHDFQSTFDRGCRLESDSLIHIRGRASGMAVGDVLFEGFWGRERSGRYGASGKLVRFAVPSKVTGMLRCDGQVTSDRATVLEVVGVLDCRDTATLRGGALIAPTGTISLSRSSVLEREVGGGGAVRGITDMTLAINSGLIDSVTLEVGTPATPAVVAITGNIRLPGLHLFAGSRLVTPPGTQPEVLGRFVYDITQPTGFHLVSVAARPGIPLASAFFPGATSPLYRFDNAYIIADSVKVGEGYFVRYDSAITVSHVGSFISLPLEIPLKGGWNIIGGASNPVMVADIIISGTALESGFLPTSGATVPVTVILPGVGYWVRATNAGFLTLNPTP